ncbi:hypothetical protein AVMA1855_06435 [Acidovorax sp. SUPP1855]|uniref:hypothetical protein n=1 Tax=Acidovorax sp. SUPP1855 TaxID=431774 RepID=UPI0023DE61C6|nr:hypothetical protein [Acidovorax sp. SUPP1855]GKS83761.1 hypothetical protein AVMA1855_06435 [Acidovorax sp. SUPP1855]
MIKQVFEGLDASQKRVRKIATIDPIRKKIILIQPGDKVLYQSGLREKGVAGYVYVFAHATAKSIQGMIHGMEVADTIRRSGLWHGEPVLIDACNAGATSDGIASELAQVLRTHVTAPTTTTWNYPLGGSAVGQGAFEKLPGVLAMLPMPDLLHPGVWRTWGPDGQPIATAPTSPRDTGDLLKGALMQKMGKRR